MVNDCNRVCLVDDDGEMLAATAQWLELSGYEVIGYSDALKALGTITPEFNGIVVSDVKMPKMDGMEFLARLNQLSSDIPVVLITAHGDVQMAVDAMRQGAYDFIEKPFEPERLLDVVQRACEKRDLVMENRKLKIRLSGSEGIEQKLIGNHGGMKRLREEILDIADTKAPVLITGETGTGKEIVARCLHEYSSRKERKYVAVDCGAIPEAVFESELFGHEKGAFTTAIQRRIGRFEHAKGGTLFLDEIVSMPFALQVKVLRALQEKEVIRIGSNEPQALDIRLISATNRDLLKECSEGRFRDDLYYRINVVELRIPPLRKRGEDILLLFDYFTARAAKTYQRPEVAFHGKDISRLMAHDWPGNVRELKNLAERYVLSSLPLNQRLSGILRHSKEQKVYPTGASLQALMRYHERLLLEQALIRYQGDVQAVMAALGLPRRTLNEKLSRHELDRKNYC